VPRVATEEAEIFFEMALTFLRCQFTIFSEF